MMKGSFPSFSFASGGAGPSGTSPSQAPGLPVAGSAGFHLITARFGSQGFPFGSTEARL